MGLVVAVAPTVFAIGYLVLGLMALALGVYFIVTLRTVSCLVFSFSSHVFDVLMRCHQLAVGLTTTTFNAACHQNAGYPCQQFRNYCSFCDGVTLHVGEGVGRHNPFDQQSW